MATAELSAPCLSLRGAASSLEALLVPQLSVGNGLTIDAIKLKWAILDRDCETIQDKTLLKVLFYTEMQNSKSYSAVLIAVNVIATALSIADNAFEGVVANPRQAFVVHGEVRIPYDAKANVALGCACELVFLNTFIVEYKPEAIGYEVVRGSGVPALVADANVSFNQLSLLQDNNQLVFELEGKLAKSAAVNVLPLISCTNLGRIYGNPRIGNEIKSLKKKRFFISNNALVNYFSLQLSEVCI